MKGWAPDCERNESDPPPSIVRQDGARQINATEASAERSYAANDETADKAADSRQPSTRPSPGKTPNYNWSSCATYRPQQPGRFRPAAPTSRRRTTRRWRQAAHARPMTYMAALMVPTRNPDRPVALIGDGKRRPYRQECQRHGQGDGDGGIVREATAGRRGADHEAEHQKGADDGHRGCGGQGQDDQKQHLHSIGTHASRLTDLGSIDVSMRGRYSTATARMAAMARKAVGRISFVLTPSTSPNRKGVDGLGVPHAVAQEQLTEAEQHDQNQRSDHVVRPRSPQPGDPEGTG